VNAAADPPGALSAIERSPRSAGWPLPAWKRWTRWTVPPLFLMLVASAAYVTVTSGGHSISPPRFSHAYPPDPAAVERPKVTGFPPPVARADEIRAQRVTSLAALSRLVSKGAIRQTKSKVWLLTRPVAITHGASLLAVGPGSLEIGPHAYLESAHSGSVTLKGLRIAAVDSRGRALSDPTPGRGFLLADRGRIVLEHDAISFLGALGPLSYGISMHAPTAGSAVVDCTIDHGYIGIYLTGATGVSILRNQVTNSVVYGIDPHSGSASIDIEENLVAGSGVHGIVLAEGVHDSRIVNNTVQDTRDHGIVLFGHATANEVTGNHVERSFDGIVLTDSSRNSITSNVVQGQRRFGLRVSGQSRYNRIDGNVFAHGLVGAYLFGGATQNSLLDDRFLGNYENVRVRADAPSNRVWPAPPRSELSSK
jgi:parallel beta-helix repeat protein